MSAIVASVVFASGCDDQPPLVLPRGDDEAQGGGGGDAAAVTALSTTLQSTHETEPALAVADDGTLAVAWTAHPEVGPSYVGYRFSTDDGETWSEPGRLTAPSDEQASCGAPDLTSIFGSFRASFLCHRRSAQGGAVYSAETSDAATFGAPVQVTDDETVGFYARPRIAVTGTGRVLIAYTALVAGASQLVVATSPSSSQSWQSFGVTEGGDDHLHPHPCGGGGTNRVYMTSLTRGRALLWRSDDNGETWQVIEVQAGGEQGQVRGPPSCAAAGTHVWVSYGLRSNGAAQRALRVAHSADRGETVSDRGTVSEVGPGLRFGAHRIVLSAPERAQLFYYAGAGPGDQAGSLRQAQLEVRDDVEIDGFPPVGLPLLSPYAVQWSTVHAPVTLELSPDNPAWIGDDVGVSVSGGVFYVAHVDNGTRASHVHLLRVEP